jgi:hypothetical protein
LSESLNAAIVSMVIVTTFVAPPLLRVAFGDLDQNISDQNAGDNEGGGDRPAASNPHSEVKSEVKQKQKDE